MKHRFVSAQPDGADVTLVQSSNWNDAHIFSFHNVNASIQLAMDADIILANAIGAPMALTLPNTSQINVGQPLFIKKIDSSSNEVTILPSGLQSIDGSSVFALVAANQVVCLVFDGSNWQILHS